MANQGQLEVNEENHSHSIRSASVVRIGRALVATMQRMSSESVYKIVTAPNDTEALIEALSESLLDEGDLLSSKEKAILLGGRAQKAWLEERGGCLTADEAAKLLGVRRQTINNKRTRNELLGLSVGNTGYRYPIWQFVDGKPLVGLNIVLAELNKQNLDEWSQLKFFIGHNDYLESRCPDTPIPIDALIQGEIDAVNIAAANYLEHASV